MLANEISAVSAGEKVSKSIRPRLENDDPESLPEISYKKYYHDERSHYAARNKVDSATHEREKVITKAANDAVERRLFKAKAKRDLQLSAMNGAPAINTPFSGSHPRRNGSYLRHARETDRLLAAGAELKELTSRGPPVRAHSAPESLGSSKRRPPPAGAAQMFRALMSKAVYQSLGTGVLNLSGRKFSKVPAMVFNTLSIQLGSTTRLHLAKNRLKKLPAAIGLLANLKELNVSYNQLSELPREIGTLTSLKRLCMESNALYELPDSICNLVRLKELRINDNTLDQLPKDFGRLVELEVLLAQNNSLYNLPGSFRALRKLEKLVLSHNQLQSLALCPYVVNIWDDAAADEKDRATLSALGAINWMKFIHPETNQVTYFNFKTQESRRTKPPGFLEDGDSEWEQMLDGETQIPYWFNRSTGETLWDLPKELEEKMRVDLKQDAKAPKEQAVIDRNNKLKLLARVDGCVWTVHRETDGVLDYYKNGIGEYTQWDMPAEIDAFGLLKSLRTLRLDHNFLAVLPPSIKDLTGLTDLDFSSNLINSLPKNFSDLVGLQTLNFGSNGIKFLPKSIFKMQKLEVLKMASNALKRLPVTIGKMSVLRILWLDGNDLEELPWQMKDLASLSELSCNHNSLLKVPTSEVLNAGIEKFLWDCRRRYLLEKNGPLPEVGSKRYGVQDELIAIDKRYDLDNKKRVAHAAATDQLSFHWRNAESVPEDVWEMSKLTEFRVVGNPLTDLPDACFTKLVNLEKIIIRACSLTTLPSSLYCVTKITELNLEDNSILRFPENCLEYLSALTHLRLSNNQMTELPDAFNWLTKLEELHVELNRLESLPPTIGTLKMLRLLVVSKNRLKSFPSEAMHDMPALVEIRANQNMLSRIPEFTHHLTNLNVLRLGQNQIGPRIHDEFAESIGLQRTLKQLWLYNNQVVELPRNFTHLKMLEDIKVDQNPIRSPPGEKLNEGIPAVIEYLRMRDVRVQALTQALESFSFAFIPSQTRGLVYKTDNLAPKVQDFLCVDPTQDKGVDKSLTLLTKEDVREVEQKMDRFCNARFYAYNTSLKKIMKDFKKKIKMRKKTHRSNVLQTFVKLLKYCHQHDVLEDTYLTADIHAPWGEDGAKRACYGIDLRALFRPTDDKTDPGDLRVDNVLFYEAEAAPFKCIVPGSDEVTEFPFTRSEVEDAVDHFRSPFGRVGMSVQEVHFDDCSCTEQDLLALASHREMKKLTASGKGITAALGKLVQPIEATPEDEEDEDPFAKVDETDDDEDGELSAAQRRQDARIEAKLQAEARAGRLLGSLPYSLQVLPHADGKCIRLSCICVKIVYTFEEARAKRKEELDIAMNLSIIREKIDIFMETSQAAVRLKLSVKYRHVQLARKIKRLKKAVYLEEKEVKRVKKAAQSVYDRKAAFEKGEPKVNHQFDAIEDAILAVEVVDEMVKKAQAAVDLIKSDLTECRRQKNRTLKKWTDEARESIYTKYCGREKERIITANRWTAVENDARRPWDGVDGKDFEEWKFEVLMGEPTTEDSEAADNQGVRRAEGEFRFDSDNEDEDIGKQMLQAIAYR